MMHADSQVKRLAAARIKHAHRAEHRLDKLRDETL